MANQTFLYVSGERAYSQEERDALIILITERPVVFSKRQSSIMQLNKKNAWEEISYQFAQMFPPHSGHTVRSTTSIKRWWDNYKQRLKRKRESIERFTLGLESCSPGSLTDMEKRVIEVTKKFSNLEYSEVLHPSNPTMRESSPKRELKVRSKRNKTKDGLSDNKEEEMERYAKEKLEEQNEGNQTNGISDEEKECKETQSNNRTNENNHCTETTSQMNTVTNVMENQCKLNVNDSVKRSFFIIQTTSDLSYPPPSKRKAEETQHSPKQQKVANNSDNCHCEQYIKLQEKQNEVNEKLLETLCERRDIELKTMERMTTLCETVSSMCEKVVELINVVKR